ncbi:MAG: exonuclease domain-containing protein [Oscillospiraceae bacterium]|nr:exonuclease domain-containing protein [Oscillospiraceae bacterium]
MEWNQGYPRSEADKLDEIIQIGAYRLEDWRAEGEAFSAYVRPTIHRKLHHRVRKMLPLDQKELFRADRFPEVATAFFEWCGEDATFFTWGPSDARVLDLNLIWYGMEEYLSLEIYDLQRAFDLMIMGTDQQTALKDAVEALGLASLLEFHDAGNDAYYTARIGAAMIERLGELPSAAELAQRERELSRQRRERAAQAAALELERVFAEEEPLLDRDCGLFAAEGDCLRSRNARVFRCPKCENMLCNGNWYQLGEQYVARSRCMEHGRFYTILRQEPEEQGVRGRCRVFNDEVLPAGLFSLCKLGGEVITVRKLPRKRKRAHNRKRSRTRTKTLTVKPAEGKQKER